MNLALSLLADAVELAVLGLFMGAIGCAALAFGA